MTTLGHVDIEIHRDFESDSILSLVRNSNDHDDKINFLFVDKICMSQLLIYWKYIANQSRYKIVNNTCIVSLFNFRFSIADLLFLLLIPFSYQEFKFYIPKCKLDQTSI